MEDYPTVKLSRRERQIMNIVYQRGHASVADVLADLPDAPSYSTVRALLRILEEKGHLTHQKDGPRYIYRPTQSRHQAGRFCAQTDCADLLRQIDRENGCRVGFRCGTI